MLLLIVVSWLSSYHVCMCLLLSFVDRNSTQRISVWRMLQPSGIKELDSVLCFVASVMSSQHQSAFLRVDRTLNARTHTWLQRRQTEKQRPNNNPTSFPEGCSLNNDDSRWQPCRRLLSSADESVAAPLATTANLRNNIMDFRGFDSSMIFSLRGGIPRPIGDFLESLSRAISVGIMLGGRLAAKGSDARDMRPSVCPLRRSAIHIHINLHILVYSR